MKRIVISLVVLILFFGIFPSYVKAEDNSSQTMKEIDINLDKKNNLPLYVRAGVGIRVGIIKLNLHDLNQILKSSNQNFRQLDNEMNVIGIEAIAGVREGNRFGAYFLHGNTESIAKSGERVDLEMNYGGVLYERGIYMKRNIDLSLGTGIAFGKTELNLLHYRANDLNDAVGRATGTSLEEDFILLEPRIKFYQQLTSTIAYDLSLGYMLTHNLQDNWDLNGYNLDNSLDNFAGPTISFRLTFGI
ncbi:hypothetical protein [Orenia marismortui]|uniref:hypothetical protein n=1 Tax=Orenia marismortui TaxID=46469 RepID=UPI000371C9B7|nr:hypothetical protein [Orenia marismortui]